MNIIQRAIHDRLFRAGVVVFVLGSGPLLVSIIASELGITRDPNPNPVGFGILAMFTFWPSLAMMAVGFWNATRASGPGATNSRDEDD